MTDFSIEKSGLIQSYITFDSVATEEQKERMSQLRSRLSGLSRNPFDNLGERFSIAREIYCLKCETICTITSHAHEFHSN